MMGAVVEARVVPTLTFQTKASIVTVAVVSATSQFTNKKLLSTPLTKKKVIAVSRANTATTERKTSPKVNINRNQETDLEIQKGRNIRKIPADQNPEKERAEEMIEWISFGKS